MMSVLDRVVRAGEPDRKSRFHDRDGHLLPVSSLMSVPLMALDLGLRAIGHRRAVPWLSYRAVRDIEKLVRHDWRVLEFGAGNSTIWFAQRVATVVSIESSPEWYGRVSTLLARSDFKNVRLLQRDSVSYAEPFAEGPFDFALVDGDVRTACAKTAVELLRSDGYLYLDNVDKDAHDAEQFVRGQLARKANYRVYVDFAPGLAQVTRGLLVHLQPD